MKQKRLNLQLHDDIIYKIVNVLNTKDYDIYTNPGQEKNVGISHNYPDVIMTEKNQNTVKFILEVETTESIKLSEAESQWKRYANEIKATFYIVVPESEANLAKMLCQKIGINARFATYSVDMSGEVLFNFN